ncbi:MAG TPA: DAK2 domain-containing protein [Mycobacteriales bacterium]|nr:DAK2 domain-containing protein [Mycobacteriales bacterium]
MAGIDALDSSAVRRWCTAAVDALEARRAEIDDLNVYPVPDGDTGTNMLLTLRAADEAVRADPAADLAATVRAMARGAVLGARGNSGVIVSQVLRGVAEALADAAGARGAALAGALARGAELAWSAVGEPVEGTMLSVARGAAEAAATAGDRLADVAREAVGGAVAALERTPSQLPALARAGVVDAGGRGLVVLLEALAGVVAGTVAGPGRTPRPARDGGALDAVREAGSPDYGYEVQYLLACEDGAVGRLKEELGRLGDSLVVVDTGEGRWAVHVHVNDVGAAIEAGVEAGRPHRITVTRFADAAAEDGARRDGVAVVAVAPGAGVAGLFAAEGVVVVGGSTGVPDEDEVVVAIEGCGAAAVVLLPGSAEVTALADVSANRARGAGIDVAVVPTRSPVQGLAAVAVHDEARRFADDVIAMAEAAAATRSAEVAVAARDALTMAGPCRAGDVLGLADGEVVLIGQSIRDVAGDLLHRMLSGGGELVTLVLGADAEPDLAGVLEHRLAREHPGVEVTVYAGGQPDAPVLIGVE